MVNRCSALSPVSTCCSCQKLLMSSPAPMSNTSESATSATTNAARSRRSAPALFERRVQIKFDGLKSWREAEDHACQQRHEQRETEHPSVQRHLARTRNLLGTKAREQP